MNNVEKYLETIKLWKESIDNKDLLSKSKYYNELDIIWDKLTREEIDYIESNTNISIKNVK